MCNAMLSLALSKSKGMPPGPVKTAVHQDFVMLSYVLEGPSGQTGILLM